MKLVAGLGNPGRKYQGTRHNIGWEVLAATAQQFGGGKPREKFNGEIVEGSIGGEKVVFLCPLTYMNLSGSCVQPARDFFKLDNSEILVVCDDFHLPAAKLRVRSKGSSGGQKGLEDIIRRLGTNEVARLRIGIGEPPPDWQVSSYVLSKFTPEERPLIDEAVRRATQAIEIWVTDGIAACMNRFNADERKSEDKPDQPTSDKQKPGERQEAKPTGSDERRKKKPPTTASDDSE